MPIGFQLVADRVPHSPGHYDKRRQQGSNAASQLTQPSVGSTYSVLANSTDTVAPSTLTVLQRSQHTYARSSERERSVSEAQSLLAMGRHIMTVGRCLVTVGPVEVAVSNYRLQMVCSVPRRLMAALPCKFSVSPPRLPCEGSLEVGGAHVHV